MKIYLIKLKCIVIRAVKTFAYQSLSSNALWTKINSCYMIREKDWKVYESHLSQSTEVRRDPFIHFQKMFLKKSYCRPNSVNDSNFMPGSWHLVEKCQKGPKNCWKMTKIIQKTHFPKKILSWLVWNTSIAIKWWKKNGVII